MGGASIDQVAILHLRYFLSVMRCGTINAAADELRISQPSLSQQIARLEANLGLTLFARSRQGMRPTAAGVSLAGSATRWLTELEALRRGSQPSRLAITRGTTPAEISALVDRFGPDTEFVTSTSLAAPGLVLTGAAQAALIRGPAPITAGLQGEIFAEQRLGLLLSAAAANALLERPVRIAALKGWELLWFDRSRAPRYSDDVLTSLAEHGWQPELRLMDPAGDAATTDALRRGSQLVALRPEPDPVPDGLVWLPVRDGPSETRILITAAPARFTAR